MKKQIYKQIVNNKLIKHPKQTNKLSKLFNICRVKQKQTSIFLGDPADKRTWTKKLNTRQTNLGTRKQTNTTKKNKCKKKEESTQDQEDHERNIL